MPHKIINKLLKIISEIPDKELINYLQKNTRHFFPTYAISQDDEPFKPSKQLLDVVLAAIQHACNDVNLADIEARANPELKKYIQTYPGEHYKLLAGIVVALKPKLIVEVGTYTGSGALALKKYLPEGSRVVTYDIFPWNHFQETVLHAEDFNNQFEQRIIDLSDDVQAETQIDMLKNAELFFIDAAKDGVMEKKFCALLDRTPFIKAPVVIFDDIKFKNMLEIWRSIKHPKIDMSSFGHWSGTGIVDWK